METFDHQASTEIETMRALLVQRDQENARLREDVAYLEALIRLLRISKFGAKSERNRHPGEKSFSSMKPRSMRTNKDLQRKKSTSAMYRSQRIGREDSPYQSDFPESK